jgi:GNAT superfamily N-acetyltransferase
MQELRGPYSFAMNDENGFLVQGFEYSPAILMGHSHPSYPVFAEKYGFTKLMDSMAYRFDLSQINFDVHQGPEIFHRIAERARQRHGGFLIRNPNLQDWDHEIGILHHLYNTSLSVLPDFVYLELAEFRSLANSLKQVIDPELVFIAEVDGKPAGFALDLPNIMEAFKVSNGLRYPWDYLRFAWARRHITGASFKILAVDPAYWGYGLEAAMFVEIGKAMIRKGYTWGDGSLTGEDNPQTHKYAQRLGARAYRIYREYRLEL